MTRVTNFRRKRTYVEAGFEQEQSEPAPKKTKKSKSDVARSVYSQRKKSKDERVTSSETRRLKRISEKLATTTCFACRETGHTAKDCPKSPTEARVGICYRCGSTKHTLSRCKKPVDDMNPLPFASCFVCKGQGHLASSCPENQQKGVYPNGGSCKLCGATSHLAKDCELRKKGALETSGVIGMNGNVGADEDDFHSFGRLKRLVEKEEDAAKRKSAVAKPKVVYF